MRGGEDRDAMDLTPQDRAALIQLIDHEMHRIEVMRARGWPLATPAELIPAAFRGLWNARTRRRPA